MTEIISPPNIKQQQSNRKLKLLIILLVFLLVTILYYGFFIGNRICADHRAQQYLVHQMYINIAYSHLYTEDLINGNKKVRLGDIQKYISRAHNESLLLLKTINLGSSIIDNSLLRQQIQELNEQFKIFKEFFLREIYVEKKILAGSDMAQKNDLIFQRLIISAEKVEETVRRNTEASLQKLRVQQGVLILISLMITLLIGVLFRRSEHLRLEIVMQTQQQLRTKINELTTLNSLVRKISMEIDISKLAQVTLEEICKVVGVEKTVIYLKHDEQLIMMAEYGQDKEKPWIGSEFRLVSQHLCNIANQGEAVYLSNIWSDSRCSFKECKDAGFCSFVALPLMEEDKVLGILGVASIVEKDFSKFATFLNIIAEHLAIGLQNHLLYEQQEAQAQILQDQIHLLLLNSGVGTLLTESETVKEMLNRCSQLIVSHLDAALVRIWTTGATDNILELQASAGLSNNINGVHSRKNIDNHNKIGRIALYKQAHVTNTVKDDPQILDQQWVEEKAIQSFAGHPLMMENDLVGVIGVFACHQLSEETITALASITDIISLGIRRKWADEALRRSNRALTILSKCNESLIHAKDEMELLHQICNIVAGPKGYRMAWVGYAEHNTDKTVHVMAYGGSVDDYLDNLKISWGDSKSGQVPTGQAIRTGHTVVMQDILTDPHFDLWKQPALQHGYVASIAIPLLDEASTVIGALNIYSQENNSFDKDEVKLLEELANDLAFGIISIRMRQKKAQLEHQLRQSQKMEMIGTLAGGIAHDFNNLLNVIFGYTGLLMDDLEKGTKQYEFASGIMESGKRASELIKQILAFGRKSESERKPLQAQIIIKEALKMLTNTLPSTIIIKQDIANCGVVMADTTQIHQVFINLCTNAYHAMRETGGTMNIKLSEVTMTQKQAKNLPGLSEGRYLKLVVSDTGYGMDSLTLGHIFEPYFTTKEHNEGTGLGLATAHGIVADHNGIILAESLEGKGSTFSVYLPTINETVTPNDREEIEEGAPLRGDIKGNVLFVDDVRFNVLLGQHLLERLGCNVVGMTDSVEAWQLLKADPDKFDLLVTDQTMPALTGVELSRKILEIRPELPIILITGYSDLVDEKKAKAIGIKEYLMKPFEPQVMGKVVRKLLIKETSR